MIILGLTGSIGMGKSTTAKMFVEAGVPVHDSDETVHRLYSGRAAPLIEARFPGVTANGSVDRQKLAGQVLDNPAAMRDLEAIIHPLVRAETEAFLTRNRDAGTPIVVLDIPLLFETGGEGRVDRIVVVTAPAGVQRERVLARPGMTAEKFEAIRARQVPDADKRAKADYVIDTSLGLKAARASVNDIVRQLSGGDRAETSR